MSPGLSQLIEEVERKHRLEWWKKALSVYVDAVERLLIRRGVFMRNLAAEEFLAQVHNNLGVIYSEREEYARAAEEYRRAIELHPRFPVGHYNYGNDFLKQGDFHRAARHFSKSLRLYTTDVWALNNRGLAYMNMKMGKPKKERRDFEEALRIDPGFEQARRNLDSLDGRQSPP